MIGWDSLGSFFGRFASGYFRSGKDIKQLQQEEKMMDKEFQHKERMSELEIQKSELEVEKEKYKTERARYECTKKKYERDMVMGKEVSQERISALKDDIIGGIISKPLDAIPSRLFLGFSAKQLLKSPADPNMLQWKGNSLVFTKPGFASVSGLECDKIEKYGGPMDK